MEIGTRERDGVLILQPKSNRIARNDGLHALRDAFRDSFEDGRLAVAVDLDGIEYADLELIRILVDEYVTLNRYHGYICLFNVHEEVYEFFRQTVLDELIGIHSSEDDAIAEFEDRPKRRRLPRGVTDFFAKFYSWGYGKGVVPDRRRDGTRRVHPDRRQVTDRRSRNGDAVPVSAQTGG